jgi:lactoylglutathione lyase/methylmalonyl-CoA/ethylmalonyl-CoA epimerase
MIKKIAYIGVAVKNIEQARKKFTENLGSEIIRVGDSNIDHVKNTYLTVGDDVFELIEPTSQESPVAKFLENRGEGVQYIGLEVTELDEMMGDLRGKGFRFTTEKPVAGSIGVDRKPALKHHIIHVNWIVLRLDEF